MLKNLFDELLALLDLMDAQPDAGIDVAGLQDRHFEVELAIGCVARPLARIEGAAAATSDIPPGTELASKFCP